MPGQDAAVVGGVILERLASGHHVVDADGYGAREASRVGHGVRVGVEARVVSPSAAHVITLDPAGAVAILAEQLFRGNLREESRVLEVGGTQVPGPGHPVLEEPRSGAVHFQPVHHVPLLERPRRRIEAGRVDRHEARAPAVVQPDLLRRLSLDDERAKVAMQHRARCVLQPHGEHEDGRPVGHGDPQRLERPGQPWMVAHVTRRLEVDPLPAERVPAIQLGPERQAVAPGSAGRQERRVQRYRHLGPGRNALAQLLAHGHVQRRVQVAERHSLHQLAQPGFFLGTVVTPVAVPFVDHVVELGVEPAGDLGVAAEGVQRAVIVPAPIDVASAPLVAPHVPELAVDVRLKGGWGARLPVTGLEVPRGARVRAVAHHPVVLLPGPAWQVGVPRVHVGLGVAAAATG